jgi:hypothetical protein
MTDPSFPSGREVEKKKWKGISTAFSYLSCHQSFSSINRSSSLHEESDLTFYFSFIRGSEKQVLALPLGTKQSIL